MEDGESFELKTGASLLLIEKQNGSRPVWTTGIKSIDSQFKNVFTSGRVIGIAHAASSYESTALACHIISTFLISQPLRNHASVSPSVFIVCPPSSQTTLSIATQLESQLQSTPPISRPDSTSLLSQVQLLQYLSMSGLTESISDVSSALFDSSQRTGSFQTPSPPVVVLVQGLSSTLNETQRRTGSVQATAIATNILRSLTHLSRTYSNLLVLVEFDLVISRPPSGESSHQGSGLMSLTSAFASSRGEVLSLGPPSTTSSSKAPSSWTATSLTGILEAGVDSLLAIHSGFGKTAEHDRAEAKKQGPDRGHTSIVEMIKDRIGDKTGEWCLWVRSSNSTQKR